MKAEIFKGDVRELLPIIEIWQKEASGSEFGITIEIPYHLEDLDALVNCEDTDLLVLYDNDKPIGYMGIMLYHSPLGQQFIANERYYYVLPQHRGFGSLRLINAAVQWAKERGCSHIVFNINKMASGMHNKICMLYEKLGMKHFETSFIKEL